MVFFGANDHYLHALDMNSKEVWRYQTSDVVACSPTIHKKAIYFGSFDGYMYALSLKGELLWRLYTGGKLYSQPVIYRDRLYFGSRSGFLFCLSLGGKLIWRYQAGGEIVSRERGGIFRVPGQQLLCPGFWDWEEALELSGRGLHNRGFHHLEWDGLLRLL